MSRTIRKLCPKDYAWYIADCDFGGNCKNCELNNAPIKSGDISNSEKDMIHELIKLYSSSEESANVE